MVRKIFLVLILSFALVLAANLQPAALTADRPVLDIYYFYSNPCASCPTVSDFEKLVAQAKLNQQADADLRIIAVPTFTNEGRQKLSQIQAEFDLSISQLQQNDFALVGPVLLCGQIEIKQELGAAIKSALVESILQPSPAPTYQTSQPTDLTSPVESVPDQLLFFTSKACSNCEKMEQLLAKITEQTDLFVKVVDVGAEAAFFGDLITRYEIKNPATPLVIYQEHYWVGYNEITRSEIMSAAGLADPVSETLLGLPVKSMSLFGATLVIGTADGFNPCSLWALMFLISMIIRFRSRRIMLVVGLTYIIVIALVYGLFVLGLFGIVMHLNKLVWLRFLMFALAFIFGIGNVISYFRPEKSLLSISESNKKKFVLFIRSSLYDKTSLPGLVGGTVLIALMASFIEMPCTAGFPVIWNSLLASQSVNTLVYSLLLCVYLLMYILIELIIVIFIVKTMSKRFMSQSFGNTLKMISGVLMVYLAILLLLGDKYLNSSAWLVGGSVLVLAAAAVFTLLVNNRKAAKNKDT